MKINIGEEVIEILEEFDTCELIRETGENSFLLGKSEDPFYVCNLGDILSKHTTWITRFPRITPFYAVKCNNSPIVVKLLAALGLSFDCASKGEISQILSYGVCPSRIIYANPCKQSTHIKYADSVGVSLMTFDSRAELIKISNLSPKSRLVIRIATDTTKARCQLGLKFGVPFDSVRGLLKLAYSLGLEVVGVSFHVGSGCFDASAYRTAIEKARSVFNIARSMGHPMKILDIGGGFPGNLSDIDNSSLFENVCSVINCTLDKFFPASSGVDIIAEPGRYYVSSAFQLSCTVTSVRENYVSSEKTMNYFLNDGVYGSFNCLIFDHYIGKHYFLDDSDNDDCDLFSSVFWGPTCDSMDKILDNFRCKLLDIGSRVIFKDMGAYTMSAGSRFNGFEPPFIRWIIDKSSWLAIASLVEGIPVMEATDMAECVLVSASAGNYINN